MFRYCDLEENPRDTGEKGQPVSTPPQVGSEQEVLPTKRHFQAVGVGKVMKLL